MANAVVVLQANYLADSGRDTQPRMRQKLAFTCMMSLNRTSEETSVMNRRRRMRTIAPRNLSVTLLRSRPSRLLAKRSMMSSACEALRSHGKMGSAGDRALFQNFLSAKFSIWLVTSHSRVTALGSMLVRPASRQGTLVTVESVASVSTSIRDAWARYPHLEKEASRQGPVRDSHCPM